MHIFSYDDIFHPTATSVSKRNGTCLVIWSGNLASAFKIICKQPSRQDVPDDGKVDVWLLALAAYGPQRSEKFRGALRKSDRYSGPLLFK